MANHFSAVKRVAQTRKRTAVNRRRKGVLRGSVRTFRSLLAEGNSEQARQTLPQTLSQIDKAANKGLIHKNTAARMKSRLTARWNTLAAAK